MEHSAIQAPKIGRTVKTRKLSRRHHLLPKQPSCVARRAQELPTRPDSGIHLCDGNRSYLAINSQLAACSRTIPFVRVAVGRGSGCLQPIRC
jgi:hypothetical protein